MNHNENDFVKNIREIRENILKMPKYEVYTSHNVNTEIEPILTYRKDCGENTLNDRVAISHALTTIHIHNEKEWTWKKRVLKGANLLDNIKPGWEDLVDFNKWEVHLKFLSYYKSILCLIYEEDDIRKILPIVFAGMGLENVKGMRRQPGPPPPLHGPYTDPWEGEITTGHYREAEMHGFSVATTRSPDYIDSGELAMLWIDCILLRKINSLIE